jgi:hypothetical protein
MASLRLTRATTTPIIHLTRTTATQIVAMAQAALIAPILGMVMAQAVVITPTLETTTLETTIIMAPLAAAAPVVVTLSLVDSPPTIVRLYSRIETPFTHIFADQNGNPGACGNYNSDSALIGAIDIAWYGNTGAVSQYCGRSVQITNLNNGKTVEITVADVCPTCDTSNSFDLSVGAFSAIADLSDGEVPITWFFN